MKRKRTQQLLELVSWEEWKEEGEGEREADRVEGDMGGVAGVEKNESEEIRLIPI